MFEYYLSQRRREFCCGKMSNEFDFDQVDLEGWESAVLGDLWVGELLVSEDDEAESCEAGF